MLSREAWQMPHPRGKWETSWCKVFHVVPTVRSLGAGETASKTAENRSEPVLFCYDKTLCFYLMWKTGAEWATSGWTVYADKISQCKARAILSWAHTVGPLKPREQHCCASISHSFVCTDTGGLCIIYIARSTSPNAFYLLLFLY